MLREPLEGRYAVRQEVGTGGHGHVFLAEDLKLGRAVAVKVLGPTSPGGELEAVQRIEREGRVASAINHPNVCAVSDIGRLKNGRPFLVLELLHGETLAARLARVGKLAVDVAIDLAQQILLGLAAAHRIGVIHRDIKPANIFLVDLGHGREQVKLLDFGTAQVPGVSSDGDTLTTVGLVVGTVHYMSPEQLRGMRSFDARTDVYATGVVLYEMLTGRRPFQNVALDEEAQGIAFKQVPGIESVVPVIAPHIARAIDLALALDVATRHADAGVFLEALQSSTEAFDDWELPTREATPSAKKAPASAAPRSAPPPASIPPWEQADVGDWGMATEASSPEHTLVMNPGSVDVDVEVEFTRVAPPKRRV
jgi:serine/threonine-protein kinase